MSTKEKTGAQITALTIITLIIFFPVGLFLMWRYTNWSKRTKIIITVIWAIIFLLIFQSSSSEPKSPSNPNNSNNSQADVSPKSLEQNKPDEPTSTPTPSALHFNDGTFTVGQDIQPGTYRTRKASNGCYFTRLRGFSGGFEDIIANENTDKPTVVSITTTDKGFSSARCGEWTQDLSQITSSKTVFDDGVYIVGTDIEPGTYTNTPSEGCYWSRLKGFTHGFGDIITNNNTDTQTIITIASTDKGFKSSRCGTWTKK